MAQPDPAQSSGKAPSLIAYEARWAVAAMRRDFDDMTGAREDVEGTLEIIERLAEGAVAPWTQATTEAVHAIRNGFIDLAEAIHSAEERPNG